MEARRNIAVIALLSLIAQIPGFSNQGAQQIAKLNIDIVEGEGAVNNVRQRMARAPMVQVTDENRKPVAGAVVVFLLPNNGASASFINGARTLSVMTDANGNAVAQGMQANRLPGQYQMQVTASFNGVTATTTITMTNLAVAGAAVASVGLVKWLIIAGAVAGGAAATGVVVSNGGGTGGTGGAGGGNPGGGGAPGPRPPTTVTPGTPTVGAP